MSILGAKTCEVTYLDGRKESVQLRRLSLRQLYRFIEVIGGKDSAEMVALCTGRPVEWIDSLEDDSGAALAKLCSEENFPRAARLAQVDPLAGLKMGPFFVAAAEGMAAAQALGTTGNSSSPAQQPSESAVAILAPVSTSPSTNSSPSSAPTNDSAPKIS